MSLRLRLLDLALRLFSKLGLGHLRDPKIARRRFERSARWVFRTPPFSLILPTRLASGLPALWIAGRPSRLPARRRVILYFHGGGYVLGSPRTHSKMLARLSHLSGQEICAPAYRLAPEHPFPAAFEDACAAFDGLIRRGYAPGDIVLGGDSAGGGLALALLARLCAEQRPPRAVFAFSPLTDMSFQGASWVENVRSDALLPSGAKAQLRDMVLAGQRPDDPRPSPLYAEFHRPIPPVFLQFSTDEILRDDSRRMARHLRAAGAVVVEDAWPGMPHVWVVFDGLVPEARAALRRVATFIRDV